MSRSRLLLDYMIRLRAYPVVRRTQEGAVVGGCSALVIFGLASAGQYAHALFLMASFGASCVLVLTLPQSPLAQPRNVIGGHILSAAAGLLSLSVFGQTPLSMAAGVGLAIFAMAVTATLHPPGAGNPVIVIGGGYGLWYLVTPVATGAVVIVAFALLYHRLVSGHIYPVRKV
ncbi:CBS-domain-containing membrane protein [Pseudochelatococcus lubricantis]|uniref:CBS-domain-containing membrane protein n=1 Tax=Pseudochelatococcus lubricantis TaxID=1538102 RepID=A0ABX0V5W0_9HYPH|nr:CBS-domain-containing membrane protein [Pseudochelatococcus lubricantis]